MTKEETEKLKKALEDFLNAPKVDAKSVFLWSYTTKSYAIKAPEHWEMLEPFARASKKIIINAGALNIDTCVGCYQGTTIVTESGKLEKFLCFPTYNHFLRCYLTLEDMVEYYTTFSKRIKLETIYKRYPILCVKI